MFRNERSSQESLSPLVWPWRWPKKEFYSTLILIENESHVCYFYFEKGQIRLVNGLKVQNFLWRVGPNYGGYSYVTEIFMLAEDPVRIARR